MNNSCRINSQAQLSGSYFSPQGAWLGFSREDARIRTVQLPATGIVGGTFARIALIADVNRPASSNPATNASAGVVSNTAVDGDIPNFDAADIPVWQYEGVPLNGTPGNYSSLCATLWPDGTRTPCSYLHRVSALKTQISDDGQSDVVPAYWTMRGLVITRDQSTTAPAAARNVSALIERRNSFLNYTNVVEGAKSNSTLVQFPPMASLVPTAVAQIKFARTPPAPMVISQTDWLQSQLQAPWCGSQPNAYGEVCRYVNYYPAGAYPD